jgi:imidazolonepropionase-like amidohydrolase
MTERNTSTRLAIVGATLIDGTGSPPVPDSTVLVHGERIERVGPRDKIQLPSDVKLIEAKGRWLLPGLVDLHVHLYHPGFVPLPPKGSQLVYASVVAANNLRSALQAGITTLRGVSDGDHLDLAMRSAVQRRMILGPRLFVAGKGICMTGGHGSGLPGVMHEVDGPWAVRKAVREEVKAGVDLIKLLSSHRTDCPEFTQEEIDAGVDEAHRHGRKIAIHVANDIGVRMAAKAGVDTIEHGSFVDEESADLMAKKGIVLIPTLWVKNHIPEKIKRQKEQAADKRIFNLSEADLEETLIWFEQCVEQLPKTMRLVKSKGIPVGTGTDNVFGDQPFAVLPEEIEWLTKYGYSNMEAIVSATRIGAEALGKEKEFGTVEQGKYADLIMVERDPLKDIAVLKEVSWVMKEGTVVPQHPEWKRRPIADPQTLR